MKKILALLALVIFISSGSQAQDIPDSPEPPKLVNDLADALGEEEENYLEQKLLAWEDSTSNQLAIVLVKSLNGMDVADYSVRLAEKWGIGSKKNNGILLLVAMQDRKSRIEVGYGLEGRITDAISRRILSDDLKPAFKEGKYLTGLDKATTHIISAAAGEYEAEEKQSKRKAKKEISWTFIIILFVMLFLISRNRKGGGGNGGGGFLTGMLLGNMLGGNRHSSWGDFSSGSGSFGGFGGGSFGGGGASGDW
jgi:uncharacterized protein